MRASGRGALPRCLEATVDGVDKWRICRNFPLNHACDRVALDSHGSRPLSNPFGRCVDADHGDALAYRAQHAVARAGHARCPERSWSRAAQRVLCGTPIEQPSTQRAAALSIIGGVVIRVDSRHSIRRVLLVSRQLFGLLRPRFSDVELALTNVKVCSLG